MNPSFQDLSNLEESLGYSFKNKNLLVESLSHPSLKQYSGKNHSNKDYERFELLGDAILGFVITEIIFRNFSNYDEGQLAKIKSYLVCKDVLCKIAIRLNIARYIIMTTGEELSGGRLNPNNLENTMEAVIAAIYLDSNIETVKIIIAKLWENFLDLKNINFTDPKSLLQEWSQANLDCKPHYRVIDKSGSAHMPVFTVEVIVGDFKATASNSTIKSAEKAAADKLIKQIKLL